MMAMAGTISRLASLSEKNVKQDQTRVENILESNRQSELEKDFRAFYDHDRVDACEKMQAKYGHEEDDFVHIYYPRLACLIFETAYEQAKEVYEASTHSLKEITKFVIDNAADIGRQLSIARKWHKEGNFLYEHYTFPVNVPLWKEGLDHLLKDVMDGVALSIKEAAPTCRLQDSLTNDVADIAFTKWGQWLQEDETCSFTLSWTLLLSEDLIKYIKACFRLSWKMVTQIPPMKLEYHCSEFNKEIHKKVFRVQGRKRSSTQKDQEKEIKCYLWPGLQDGRGRRIHSGEVLCKLKQK